MKFFYKDIELEVPEDVYFPGTDSRLLAEVLEQENLKGKAVLEVGCGSGFLSILASKMGAKVFAVDAIESAIDATIKNAAKNSVFVYTEMSDLFENVTGRSDLIIFNPPYLPENEEDKIVGPDKRWSGGKTGRKVIEKFIKSVSEFLNKRGKILMVFSSLTGEKEILELLEKRNFNVSVIKREKISWEELIVIEAKLK